MDYYRDPDIEYVDADGLELSLEERAEKVREATTLVDDVRPFLPYLGKTKVLEEDARTYYGAGKKFRVIKPGARLEGIVTFGKVKAGYAEELEVGDILISTGWRESMAGRGFMEANFATEQSPKNALWLQFWPFQGLWMPWPLAGWLEPYDEKEEKEKEMVYFSKSPHTGSTTVHLPKNIDGTFRGPLPKIKEPCNCPEGMSCEDCEDLTTAETGFVEQEERGTNEV